MIIEEHQSPDKATLDSIQKNVSYVKNQLSAALGETLDLNAESIELIVGYINRTWERFNTSIKDSLVDVLGSFLGETISEVYGGEWRINNEGMLGIKFENNAWAFPFIKTYKHYINGHEDSIRSFFNAVPYIRGGSLRKNGESK